MTNPPAGDEAPPKINVVIPPEFDEVDYFLTLPLLTAADPKITKREPAPREGEYILRLQVLRPRLTRRTLQTVRVQLPKELSNLAGIEVTAAAPVDEEEQT
jgi:hypothetical protein